MTAWTLLDVPVTLASGNGDVVVIRSNGAGIPNLDDFIVTGTDIVGPVVTVPANVVTDAAGPGDTSSEASLEPEDVVHARAPSKC